MVDKSGGAPQRIEFARALIAIAIADLVQVGRRCGHCCSTTRGKPVRVGVHVDGRHEVADAIPMHGDCARAPLTVI